MSSTDREAIASARAALAAIQHAARGDAQLAEDTMKDVPDLQLALTQAITYAGWITARIGEPAQRHLSSQLETLAMSESLLEVEEGNADE